MKTFCLVIFLSFFLYPSIIWGQNSIEGLINILEDRELEDTNRDTVINAILQLGKIKAVEASDYLAERLDLNMGNNKAFQLLQLRSVPTPYEEYPSIKALMQIGEPSVPAIIRVASQKERSEIFLLNAAYTIILIEGGNQPARYTILVEFARQYQGEELERVQKLGNLIPIVR